MVSFIAVSTFKCNYQQLKLKLPVFFCGKGLPSSSSYLRLNPPDSLAFTYYISFCARTELHTDAARVHSGDGRGSR